MRLNFLIFLFLISFSLFAQASKPKVGESEIRSTQKVQFNNKSNEFASEEFRKQNDALGKKLASEMAAAPGKVHNAGNITVKRYSQDKSGKYGGDILTISKDSQFGHVNSIYRIISSYIAETFDYNEKSADSIAFYVLYYNAIHRGNKAYFDKKYTKELAGHLKEDSVGISKDYKDWPGKTQIVIPLEKNILKKNNKDTALDELEKNVNKVIKKEKSNLDEKKKFDEVVKDKVNKEKDELKAKKAEVDKKETALNEKDKATAKKIDELKKDPEKNKEDLKKLEEEKKASSKEKEKLAEEKKELAKKEESLNKKDKEIAATSKEAAKDSAKEASKTPAKEISSAKETAPSAKDTKDQPASKSTTTTDSGSGAKDSKSQQPPATSDDKSGKEPSKDTAKSTDSAKQPSSTEPAKKADDSNVAALTDTSKKNTDNQPAKSSDSAASKSSSSNNANSNTSAKDGSSAKEASKESAKDAAKDGSSAKEASRETAKDSAAAAKSTDPKKDAEKKLEEVVREKVEKEKSEKSDNVTSTGKILFLQLLTEDNKGHYTNDLMLIDPDKEEDIIRSPFENICGFNFKQTKDGVLVIGFDGPNADEVTHNLVFLDPETLEPKAKSKETVYWRTDLEKSYNDGKYYVFETFNGKVHLSRFNPDLSLDARSSEPVNTNSDLTFNKDKIFLTTKIQGGKTRIVILNKSDLKVKKTFEPSPKKKAKK